MTDSIIFQSLNELFSEIFLRDDIALTAKTEAADIEGWDSFRQVEIFIAIEERFGVRLKTREIDNLKNIGDLVAAIAGKIV